MPREFAMTDDGDLMIDSGDAIDAAGYPIQRNIYSSTYRYLVQRVIIALRTTIGSFTIHENIGHDLDRYVGQPNTAPLRDAIQASISSAVKLVSNDFTVRVVPLSMSRLGVFTYSVNPGLDFVASLTYDVDEGFLVDQTNFIFG